VVARASLFGQQLLPWFHYAVGLGGLAMLLVPRSTLWARRWAQARLDQRLLLARTVSATSQVS
jgi:hypothetical protein